LKKTIRKSGASKNVLLIFIKNPILGQVKTRLASSVGDEEAMRIYKELLKHTRAVSLKLDATRVVCYSHFIDAEDSWLPQHFVPYLEEGDNLGTRMSNAFETAFQEGAEKVVVIGSDCPKISTEILGDAFKALTDHKMVIGPSMDGGYYLLGMSHYSPELFNNINWSTPSVFEETTKRAKQLQIQANILPTLSDVDYLEDWEKYGW